MLRRQTWATQLLFSAQSRIIFFNVTFSFVLSFSIWKRSPRDGAGSACENTDFMNVASGCNSGFFKHGAL